MARKLRKHETGKHRSVIVHNPVLFESAIQLLDELGVRKIITGVVRSAKHRYEPGAIKARYIDKGSVMANGYLRGAVVSLVLIPREGTTAQELVEAIEARWQ